MLGLRRQGSKEVDLLEIEGVPAQLDYLMVLFSHQLSQLTTDNENLPSDATPCTTTRSHANSIALVPHRFARPTLSPSCRYRQRDQEESKREGLVSMISRLKRLAFLFCALAGNQNANAFSLESNSAPINESHKLIRNIAFHKHFILPPHHQPILSNNLSPSLTVFNPPKCL